MENNKNLRIKPDGSYQFKCIPQYGEPFYRFVVQKNLIEKNIIPGSIVTVEYKAAKKKTSCHGEVLIVDENGCIIILEKTDKKTSIITINHEDILDLELHRTEKPTKEGVKAVKRIAKETVRGRFSSKIGFSKDCIINYTVKLPWLKNRNKAELDIYVCFAKGEHKKVQTTAVGHPETGAKEVIVLNMSAEKISTITDIVTVCTYEHGKKKLMLVDVVSPEFVEARKKDGATYNIDTEILPEVLTEKNYNKWMEWLYLKHDIAGIITQDGKSKVLFDNARAGLVKNVLTSITGAVYDYDLENTMEAIDKKEFPVTEFFVARNTYFPAGYGDSKENPRSGYIMSACVSAVHKKVVCSHG